MELEKKPQKPIRTFKNDPRSRAHYALFSPETIYLSKEVCFLCGLLLIVLSLVGFVMSNFLGAHLSYVANIMHFTIGGMALIFGLYSHRVARIGSLILGVFFGLFGVAGFIAGSPGVATLGNLGDDQYLWILYSNFLEFGVVDHLIHLLFAVIFFAGAFTKAASSNSRTPTFH